MALAQDQKKIDGKNRKNPETDQNILENLTKSRQSGLYDKCY